MKAFRHCSWLDEIPFTDIAGDVRIEIFHQMFPLGSHSWLTRTGSSSLGKKGIKWMEIGSQELVWRSQLGVPRHEN